MFDKLLLSLFCLRLFSCELLHLFLMMQTDLLQVLWKFSLSVPAAHPFHQAVSVVAISFLIANKWHQTSKAVDGGSAANGWSWAV